MKTILLIAAVLMTAASIYGVVDYQKTASKKNFKQLYVSPDNGNYTAKPLAEKNIAVDEKNITSVNKTKEITAAKEKKITASKVVKKKKQQRKKLELKMFSRAAMDEKYVKKTLETPKKQ
jgi:FlaG/FlaF family flagellin (archaellin)